MERLRSFAGYPKPGTEAPQPLFISLFNINIRVVLILCRTLH